MTFPADDSPPFAAPVSGFGLKCALVLLFAFVVGLIGADSDMFFDIDAPKYAEAAYEMAQTGDLARPMFNGQPRTMKPPLTYWLLLPAYKTALSLGGDSWITPFTGRIPASFFLMLTAGAAVALGARLFSPLAGLMAGLLLSASVLMKFMGLIVKVDIFFTCIMAWNGYFLLLRFQGDRRARTLGAILATSALGVLAKGPFGLLPLPGYGLAVLLSAAFCGQLAGIRGERGIGRGTGRGLGREVLVVAGAGIAATLPFFAWLAYAWAAGHTDFVSGFLAQFELNTTMTAMEADTPSRAFRLTSYFDTLVTYCSPFGVYLPAAIYDLARDARRDPTVRQKGFFLAGMFFFFLLPAVFLFRHVANRYLLPVAPFSAVLVAGWLMNARRDKTSRTLFDISSIWLVVSVLVLAWRNAKAGVLPVNLYFSFPVTDVWQAAWPLGAGMAAFFVVFGWSCLGQDQRPVRHVLVTCLGFALLLPLYFRTLPGPVADQDHPLPVLAPALARVLGPVFAKIGQGGVSLVVHSRLFSLAYPDCVFFRHLATPGPAPRYSLALEDDAAVFLEALRHPERAGDLARRGGYGENAPARAYFADTRFAGTVLLLNAKEFNKFSGHLRSQPDSLRPEIEVFQVRGLSVAFRGTSLFVIRLADARSGTVSGGGES